MKLLDKRHDQPSGDLHNSRFYVNKIWNLYNYLNTDAYLVWKWN